MIEYIRGELVELAPTYAVVEANGVGYMMNISLVCYSELSGKSSCKLLVYEAIREDAHVLYGFVSRSERDLFLLLISVSGVGANTARVILSSLSPSELQEAIMTGNVSLLKSVKGIGLKSAERIIVDLKDKVGKLGEVDGLPSVTVQDSGVKNEAVSALIMLGFQQSASSKVVDKLLRGDSGLSVEKIIKEALRML